MPEGPAWIIDRFYNVEPSRRRSNRRLLRGAAFAPIP
jgi:hypothetical protein